MATYDEYIEKRFNEHLEDFRKKFPNLELAYFAVQGSQNYGLDYYGDGYCSDLDTKAIVLPSLDDIVQNKSPISITYVRENNEHIDIKDIRVMFETFKKQNVNFIEILFSKWKYINPMYEKFFSELIENREEIAHFNYNQALRCIAGMSMEKKKALCHPYPTIKDKIEKYGYDGKQLHHIIRMNDFIKNYVAGESYENCLHTFSDKDILFNAKLNYFSLNEALEMAEKYDSDTKRIMQENLKEDETINAKALDILDKVRYNCIKRYIISQLIEEVKDNEKI